MITANILELLGAAFIGGFVVFAGFATGLLVVDPPDDDGDDDDEDGDGHPVRAASSPT